jgi:thiol:disulfide interchange protein
MSKSFWSVAVIVLLLGTMACSAFAQTSLLDSTPTFEAPLVSVTLTASKSQAPAGEPVTLVGTIRVAEGWVFYSAAPGEGPLAARVIIPLAEANHGEVTWSAPEAHPTDLGGGEVATYYVYEDEGRFSMTARRMASLDGPTRFVVELRGQVCSDVTQQCVAINESVMVTIPFGPAMDNPAFTPLVEGYTKAQLEAGEGRIGEADAAVETLAGASASWSLWTGLAAALVAGLILNIMPCVLPILPIRILTIVQSAGGSRKRYVSLGLTYALGMLLFFVALAVLNGVLQLAIGQSLQWSQHFQYAWLRTSLAMLMVVVACNFFGLFNVFVPTKLASMDVGATGKAGEHWGALGMGLMTAVLATPCSFAFLLTVLGWATLQPLWVGTVAFLLMGVGMAAPHAMLTAFPKLVDRLPKPGRWMELLRQGAGFAMLVVAAWLVSTLADAGMIMRVGIFGVSLAAGLWVWGTVVTYTMPAGRKWLTRLLTVALVVALGVWLLPTPKGLVVEFESYSDASLAESRAAGQITLVKYTATWCLSCRWVDQEIYNSPEVAEMLAEYDVTVLKADVSNHGARGSATLERFGGAPPMTLIYPAEGDPIALPGKFHKAQLADALEQAAR